MILAPLLRPRAALVVALVAAGCQGPRSGAPAQAGDPAASTPRPPSSAPGEPPGATPDAAIAASSAPPASAAPAPDAGPMADAPDAGSDAGQTAEAPDAGAARPTFSGCYEQKPQDFLIRGSYWPPSAHQEEHRRSLIHRVKQYGTIDRLTPQGLIGEPAKNLTQKTMFFGLPVHLHRKIIPALRCVEQEIQKTCRVPAYQPESLSGWRGRNTYHGGEVTNHLFGIAIDIDPHRNACCHCVEPWNKDPHCKRRKAPPEEHMEMPVCWVGVFERFGFYWLGHDRLEDTMHFEFLGDPAAITPEKAPDGR